jgi:hypothetical protein
MKVLVLAILALIGSLTWVRAEPDGKTLLGRYEPFGVDAGVCLTLLENDIFVGDWWGQDQKTGNILGDWFSGRWHREGNRLVLRYVTRRKKQCEATFDAHDVDGKTVLKLVAGDFPFAVIGEEFPKKEAPAQSWEPKLPK